MNPDETNSCTYAPAPINPAPVPPVPSNRQHHPSSDMLKDWTTMGVGGPARDFVRATTEDEIVDAIRTADEDGNPVFVLGGGSNTIVGDAGFDGVVVRDMRADYHVDHDSGCGGVVVRATGGMPWDEFVALSVQQEWSGLESLSGIPGTVGASPVQNIGAYGHEMGETLASVRVYDRLKQRRRTLTVSELGLGYRTSILKQSTFDDTIGGGRVWGPTGRWVVLEVEFHTRRASLSAPVQYAELARHLQVEPGERVDARAVRDAVLEVRRSKCMVLDDAERNTYSAGSFFTNPILSNEDVANLPDDAPRFALPAGNGVKVSAAWLIQHAGFERGWKVRPDAPASLSTAHVLALTNRGGASAADIFELASAVRRGVREKWGIELIPEPVSVGVDLRAG